MTYKEVLDHLDALQMHKIKLGLEAMQSFLEKVGRPETGLKFIHLAGTNGKGSVCAVLAEILGRAGYRVGVYTSPHLSSVRERFRIGEQYISEQAFAAIGTRICEVLGEEQITYFEFTTALGLMWFAESGVDLVLLETGMGGRLDATNVVTPLVSVITSVSMDHEAYLGNSLEEIAGEKAGIIKQKIPVVTSAVHPEVLPVISKVCGELKAPLYQLGVDFDFEMTGAATWNWTGGESLSNVTINNLKSNSPSGVQQENEALALAVLMLLEREGIVATENDIYQGLVSVVWPGRMEFFHLDCTDSGLPDTKVESKKTVRYLLDGAHNPAGVKNLASTLTSGFNYERLIAVWGSMFDKDLSSTLDTILPHIDKLILTQPDGERSASPEQIFDLLRESEKGKTVCVTAVNDAVNTAQQEAGEEDLILVGGSLYLIGAVRQLLKGDLV